MPLDFSKDFGAVVAADQREWSHDRSKTVGASEVFGCLRQTAAKKRWPEEAREPEEFDETNWGHTERGNLIENFYAVPKMRGMFGAENCFFMGDDQKTFHASEHLTATPDGCAVNIPRDALALYGVADLGRDGTEIVPEIKTFSPSAAPKNGPKPRHEGQNHVQIGVIRQHTNYQPDYGVILYINPINLKDIRPFPVRYDHRIYEMAKERAAKVFDPNAKPKDFPAEGKFPGRNDCTYCEFQDWCNGVEMSKYPGKAVSLERMGEELKAEFETLARKVKAARKAADEAEGVKKTLETELREKMFDHGTSRVGGEDWSISVNKIAGRKTLSKDKLKADGVNLDDYMVEGNPHFRMNVNVE